jgi:hypothetical protein
MVRVRPYMHRIRAYMCIYVAYTGVYGSYACIYVHIRCVYGHIWGIYGHMWCVYGHYQTCEASVPVPVRHDYRYSMNDSERIHSVLNKSKPETGDHAATIGVLPAPDLPVRRATTVTP